MVRAKQRRVVDTRRFQLPIAGVAALIGMLGSTAVPAQTVHGATPDPELRLITCRGAFDYATGHYLSNVIVCATQAS